MQDDKVSGTVTPKGNGNASPVGFGLFTLRDEARSDLHRVVAALAEVGYDAVEPVSIAGATGAYRRFVDERMLERLDPETLRRILDDHGMTVCSAHVPMPDSSNASELLDEQEALGNRLLVVPTPRLVPGFETRPFDAEMLNELAERFAAAADLTSDRGMRIGYHNHAEEFESVISGEVAFDMLFRLLDRRVFAELDVTWIANLGISVSSVIEGLGDRAVLVHSRGRLGASLGQQSPVSYRIVDLGTIEFAEDRWPAVHMAYRELTGSDVVSGERLRQSPPTAGAYRSSRPAGAQSPSDA